MINPCKDCEYAETCEDCNQVDLCFGCEHLSFCGICTCHSKDCMKGYPIACNNGYEEDGDDNEDFEE